MILTVNLSTLNGLGTGLQDFTAGNRDLGITIDGGVEIVEAFPVGNNTLVFGTVIPNGSNIRIRIFSNGDVVYTNTVSNVYSEDKTIQIVYVPTYPLGNDLYKVVFPFFFTFEDRCSYTVDIYDASNSLGSIEYYINNIQVSAGERNYTYTPCTPESLQIKQRVFNTLTSNGCPTTELAWTRFYGNVLAGNEIYGVIPETTETYLQEDLSQNLTISEFKPSIGLSISTDSLEDTCYVLDSTALLVPSVTSPDSRIFNKKLIIYSPDGGEIYNSNYVVSTDPLEHSLLLDELGSYQIVVYGEDEECGLEYFKSWYLTTINAFTIEQGTSCPNYILNNLDRETEISISILQYDDVTMDFSPLEGFSDIVIPPNTSLEVSFPEFNLYEIRLSKNEVGYSYPIVNMCVLDECLSNAIIAILCQECSCCVDECQLMNDYLRIRTIRDTVYNKLNDMFSFGNWYTSLEFTSILDSSISLGKLIKSLNSYCNTCGDHSKDCGCVEINKPSTSTKSSGCGCK